MDVKILENLLNLTIDRGNLRKRHNQSVHKRIMVFSRAEMWMELRNTIGGT